MPFNEIRTESFERDLVSYKSLRVRIDRRINKILESPYERSDVLGKGKWEDYTGKRSAKIEGGSIVFILAICEECIQNDWQSYNIPWCDDICSNQPLQRVVWLVAKGHDSAYGKR